MDFDKVEQDLLQRLVEIFGECFMEPLVGIIERANAVREFERIIGEGRNGKS